MQRIIRDLTFFYLILLLLVWAGLGLACDRWWPGTLLGFAPRWVAAVPLALLVPAALFLHIRLLPLFLVHSIVVAVPIMGLTPMGVFAKSTAPSDEWLRVMTVNTGGHGFDVARLIDLIREEYPDVVCLQECEAAEAERIFGELGWNLRRDDQLVIGSRWELGESNILAWHGPDQRQAMALHCPVFWNDRAIEVFNVHLPTPRPGIQAIWNGGIGNCDQLSKVIDDRRQASEHVSTMIAEIEGPRVIMGDFNMPVDSQIYHDSWGEFENAFSRSGWGFGYTKYTRWHAIRIDHVLTDDHWRPKSARVTADLGGDHRPVVVDLEIMP